MRVINKLIKREVSVEGKNILKVSDIKKEILKEVSGIYYKNIIVIKGGEVLEDDMGTEDSEYNFAIIPIKCLMHPIHK